MEYGVRVASGGCVSAADRVITPAGAASFPARRRALPACSELDCIRELIPPGLIAAAELRAAEIGVGADRVLISADIVSEEAYLAAFTSTYGFAFEPLDDVPRAACPLSDEQLINAAAGGILPIHVDGNLEYVVAPRALAARRLIELRGPGSELTDRIRVTTAERLQKFIARHGAQATALRATQALHSVRPDLSAFSQKRRPISALISLVALLFMLILAPGSTMTIFASLLGLFFIAWTGLRLLGPLTTPARAQPVPRRPDDRLPVYTIIIALYREAAAVKGLVTALRQLDYPGIMAQTPQDYLRAAHT